MLHIKTDQAEKTFDLPDVLRAFDLTASDRLTFTLYRSNADHFLLRLENIDKKDADKQYMALFFKQDLSRVVPVSDHAAAINQKLADGKLDEFSHLFSNHDKDAHFVKAFQTGERFIVFDSKAKQLKEINKADYLSEDGKYVYINGNKNPLPDGKQQIQTIENYMAGNDKYERTFEISFKKIAKELDLKSAKDTGIAKIVYFNKNLVVLMLQYNAPIAGKAGKTNVIVDLKNKEKPIAYLVDLGLQF
ncbi:hypothetical protein P5G51_004020 [Virgibacillus sp. 179-BFC.A HS]|uniref:DUF4868 domain-containing protein n=1 Tax=Tigheibacillus jepli TaxID=3035914 RepID=A0ABU5CEA8_9BACI|nr:hypothetical protein [Virgibacillus sp. 179-BFC.A HS]MDY0404677.1 hypothetical protein [Virgibacillus sp. 179-BFC.A HS]